MVEKLKQMNADNASLEEELARHLNSGSEVEERLVVVEKENHDLQAKVDKLLEETAEAHEVFMTQTQKAKDEHNKKLQEQKQIHESDLLKTKSALEELTMTAEKERNALRDQLKAQFTV